MPESDANMVTCDVCGRSFQFGPRLYDGRYINEYQMAACRSCFEGNADGWGPAEERVLNHLKSRGIAAPKRNKKGLIPRGD